MTLPSPFPSRDRAWHTCSLKSTVDALASDPLSGLSYGEVERRLARYGRNEIVETGGRSRWEILIDQFRNVMLLMLIAVAIIAGLLDLASLRLGGAAKEEIPFKDTIAILSIVFLNALLGYLQEIRAEKALAALKRLSSPKVQVLREGRREEIDAALLVPGDIMLVEAGTQLCADGRILEAVNLQIRESALTGEAQAVIKQVDGEPSEEDTPLGDRYHMVFSGTEALQGRGKIIVTSTGMATELGKIAQMLQSVTNEPTPLQRRMAHLGNTLVTGSLILVAIVVVGGVWKGGWELLQQLVETSLSMAVAVVPEGLPAVITLTLALGTQRMVRRNALIRRLPAVETLGSVNVICSDKTGTLTQNKMIVQAIATPNESYQVTGNGYEPQGSLWLGEKRLENSPGIWENYRDLYWLLVAGMACNDAELQQHRTHWSIAGDPTEGALLVLAHKAGFSLGDRHRQWQRIGEIPFSSERKRMTVICRTGQTATDSNIVLFSKGSPELILEQCTRYQSGDRAPTLTAELLQAISIQNDRMAEQGLRVLGLARKTLSIREGSKLDSNTERDLIWLGLVGMLDAPRSEVQTAVAKCKAARIRPIMITGDHPLTATAIADTLGITGKGDRILTGRELASLSQSALEAEVDKVSVYARVSPEHKLRIVRALQRRNKFVAMTGDGVNDAPAIKQADIGIAMGITGTDVSKEASDMVLLDDNFATIVAAIEEGRVVYSNIRHFIKYILGSNVGEVITIASAPLLGLADVPLSPLQILWMNLVTDGLPALALAVEPADPDIMSQPPYNPTESIFARGLGAYILRIGLIFSAISISLMLWTYHNSQLSGNPERWKTMVFSTLCIAQMGHAIAVRSPKRLTIEMNPFSNPYLWGAVIVTTVLQLMLIYVEPLRKFFDTNFLTRQELLICLGFSSLMFVWVELEKVIVRLYDSRRSR